MTATREELIAEWRGHLAAAQAEPLALASRGAWLVRLQVRMYRLLLSLYGDGQWRSSVLSEQGVGQRGDAADGDEPLDVQPVGKPIRNPGKIAAVLKAVANAQDAPPACGPLAGGITAESWIVVASESANMSTARCAALLRRCGIVTRTATQGDDDVVYVRAADRKRALMLIRKQANQLHRRARHPEARRWRGSQWVLLGLICAPVGGIVAQVAWLCFCRELPDQRAAAWVFFAGCLASLIAGVAAQALAQARLFCDEPLPPAQENCRSRKAPAKV